MTLIHSFPPISAADATRLVLGSMPGKASLAANRYYAHPRNHFWSFVERVLDIPPGLPYDQRCAALVARQVAVWDVLKACTRASSLDSDIIESSIVPNDLVGFLGAHPHVRQVFFNGAKAEASFRRHVLPHLPPELNHLQWVRLPSTSPANASIPLAIKLEAWRLLAG